MGCETPTLASTMASNGRSTMFLDFTIANELQVVKDATTASITFALIIEGTSLKVWGSRGLKGSSRFES
jgi:hypothetical protein